MERARLPLIGVVGGIASGKSFICEQLERKGAAVVSADRLAHEVLKTQEVKQAARERWGEKIFSPSGEIDRTRLAEIVFAPGAEASRELKYLEQLTHPKVGELAMRRMQALQDEGTARAIVLDVPLMVESRWNRFCDKIVYVDVPRAVRWARASKRGWSEEDFARREGAQESLQTKRELADVVIDNSGSPESVQAQIEHLWPSLVGSVLSVNGTLPRAADSTDNVPRKP